VRFELADAHQSIARIVEALPGRVRAITVAQPTLKDVFIARTGHRYESAADFEPATAKHSRKAAGKPEAA